MNSTDFAPSLPAARATWIDRLERAYGVLVVLHVASLALGRAPIALTAYPLVATALSIAISRRRLILSPVLVIALSFAFWCVVTNLLSPHKAPAHSFGRLAPLLVSFALTQSLPLRAFDTGVRLLLALASVGAIYGVIQHFTGINIFDAAGRTPKLAPESDRFLATGFHAIHNYLGMTASLWVAIAACLGLDAWRRRARRTLAFSVASLALVGIVLLVSYSRAGWVASFVVLALAPLVVPVRRGWLLPIALSLVALLVVLPSDSLRSRLASVFSLEANADRAEILDVNLRLVDAMPWHGHGYGSYENAAAPLHQALYPERPFWFGAHSDFFQTLIETGFIGTALFLALWVAFFWAASRRLWGKRRCAEEDRWRVGAAFLIGIAFIICGISQTAFKCYEATSILCVAFALVDRRVTQPPPTKAGAISLSGRTRIAASTSAAARGIP